MQTIRIGQGIDVHRFAPERRLILGGTEIPHPFGLSGHSDADVLTHAIIDAILGALALGDIGSWFPDSDSAFKDADSMCLLKTVLGDEKVKGWSIGNLDATIVAESPKLAPFIQEMRRNLAESFACSLSQISIKATTTEKLGFCGRGEGITAMAVIALNVC